MIGSRVSSRGRTVIGWIPFPYPPLGSLWWLLGVGTLDCLGLLLPYGWKDLCLVILEEIMGTIWLLLSFLLMELGMAYLSIEYRGWREDGHWLDTLPLSTIG